MKMTESKAVTLGVVAFIGVVTWMIGYGAEGNTPILSAEAFGVSLCVIVAGIVVSWVVFGE